MLSTINIFLHRKQIFDAEDSSCCIIAHWQFENPMNVTIHSIYFIYLTIQIGLDRDPPLYILEEEHYKRKIVHNLNKLLKLFM